MIDEYPAQLSDGSITIDEFNAWKKQLLHYLEEKPEYQLFLPGGLYSDWSPLADAKNGLRIQTIHPNDPARLQHDVFELTQDEWLRRRNIELEAFIKFLCDQSSEASNRVITNYATSFELIMTFIIDSHNHDKKSKNIFELNEVVLSSNYSEFYSHFRETVNGHLKKAGARIKFWQDFELLQDEILSPTFEEVILLWCLEKIDSRLPNLVNLAFGHKLVDNLTLKDLQDDIFAKLPQILADNNVEINSSSDKKLELKEEGITNVKSIKVAEGTTALVESMDLDVKEEAITEIQQDFAEHIAEISQLLFSNGNGFDDKKVLKDDSDYEPDEEDDMDPDFDADRKDWDIEETDGELDEQRPCEFCNGCYKSKKILLEHVRGIHKVKYYCKICQITLNNHKTYEKHLKELHPHQYSNTYEDVMKTNDFVCRYCHEPQSDIHQLRDHILMHKDAKEITYLGGKYKKNTTEPRNRRGAGKSRGIERGAARKGIESGKRRGLDTALKEEDEKMENGEEEGSGRLEDIAKSEAVEDKKEHRCQECGRVFGSILWLKSHMSEHLKGASVCEFCDSRLKNKRVLSEHIRIRHRLTFKCQDCKEILKNQRVYEEHLKAYHVDSYVGQHGLKVRSNNHVCRYCLEPQSSHEALKLHTFDHRDKGEINFIVKSPYDSFDTPEEVLATNGDLFLEDKPFAANTNDSIPIEPMAPRKQQAKEKKMCDICGKYFTSVDQHKKIHNIENLHCDDCNITFPDRKEFLKHNKQHRSNEKNASCDQCGKSFTRIAHLKVHLKKHVKVQRMGGEKLKCETCKRSFFDKKEMGSHVCKHHGCDICGEKYLRARNLRLHKRMHLGEVLYPCDLCESLFLNKKRRREHFRDYHKNEKKHKCHVCDKRFLMKTGLAHHMYTHTGEKPFKCADCGIGFTQKGNLDIHMKLHTNEMPYECTVCHAKFKQSGEIKRHREVYKCGFTQDDFYNTSKE